MGEMVTISSMSGDTGTGVECEYAYSLELIPQFITICDASRYSVYRLQLKYQVAAMLWEEIPIMSRDGKIIGKTMNATKD